MDNEIIQFKNKKLEELEVRREHKRDSTEAKNAWKQTVKDIQDIEMAIRGGVTTIKELKLALRHNLSIIEEIDNFLIDPIFGGPQYQCILAGQPFGPVTIHQFANMARFGIVDSNTLVWKSGMSNWAVASTVVDFQAFFSNDKSTNRPKEILAKEIKVHKRIEETPKRQDELAKSKAEAVMRRKEMETEEKTKKSEWREQIGCFVFLGLIYLLFYILPSSVIFYIGLFSLICLIVIYIKLR